MGGTTEGGSGRVAVLRPGAVGCLGPPTSASRRRPTGDEARHLGRGTTGTTPRPLARVPRAGDESTPYSTLSTRVRSCAEHWAPPRGALGVLSVSIFLIGDEPKGRVAGKETVRPSRRSTRHVCPVPDGLLEEGFSLSVMILPQVHLRKPCYDFYFL